MYKKLLVVLFGKGNSATPPSPLPFCCANLCHILGIVKIDGTEIIHHFYGNFLVGPEMTLNNPSLPALLALS